MNCMTRKDFLRAGLAVAATGFTPLSDSEPHARALLADNAHAPSISKLNPVLRLYPAKAIEQTGDVRFGKAELSVMLPFFGSGTATWGVTLPIAGAYQVAVCYSSTVPGLLLEVRAGGSVIHHGVEVTEGFFIADPNGPSANPGGPDEDTFWSEREFYCFERVPLAGELLLSAGVNVIEMKITGPKGPEIFRLRSLELTSVSDQKSLFRDHELAKRYRAKTDWFAKAGYGIWFHFLDHTTPRRGPRKSYPEAVDDLDVRILANLVEDAGAAYVIFTTNHGDPTFPAPLPSWEELHPGWTTRRDLIRDLAEALSLRGIKLLLYMNCPGLGNLVQLSGAAVDRPTLSEEKYCNVLIKVFTEIGLRYKSAVAGYWLDSWFQTNECYPNLPFDLLDKAVHAGFPDRLVAYNNWVFPVETKWQDYWAGELTELPLKRFGNRFIARGAGRALQAHSAIRLDAPWFHITPDVEMERPLYTGKQLIDYVKICIEDQAPVSLGVGIFQDGTIGEASRDMLRQLRQAVRY